MIKDNVVGIVPPASLSWWQSNGPSERAVQVLDVDDLVVRVQDGNCVFPIGLVAFQRCFRVLVGPEPHFGFESEIDDAG